MNVQSGAILAEVMRGARNLNVLHVQKIFESTRRRYNSNIMRKRRVSKII